MGMNTERMSELVAAYGAEQGTDVRFSNPLVVKAEHLVKASKYRRFSTNQDRAKKEDANDA